LVWIVPATDGSGLRESILTANAPTVLRLEIVADLALSVSILASCEWGGHGLGGGEEDERECLREHFYGLKWTESRKRLVKEKRGVGVRCWTGREQRN
jgi:hypothetical protein